MVAVVVLDVGAGTVPPGADAAHANYQTGAESLKKRTPRV